MDLAGRTWLAMTICIVLTLLLGFFTACESAAVEITEVRLRKLLADNSKKARLLTKLLESPGRFVSANVISRSFMLAAVSAVSTYYFYPLCKGAFLRWLYIDTAHGAGYYGVCCLSFAVAVLGTVLVVTIAAVSIPRRLCACGRIGERFILAVSGVYSVWMSLFMPLVWLVELVSKGVLRIFGVKSGAGTEAAAPNPCPA